jgi:hypothetical protein
MANIKICVVFCAENKQQNFFIFCICCMDSTGRKACNLIHTVLYSIFLCMAFTDKNAALNVGLTRECFFIFAKRSEIRKNFVSRKFSRKTDYVYNFKLF